MCRWFAYISPTEPCLLEDVIISSKHSLTNQVHEHFLPGLVAHDPRDISKDHLITARNVIYNIDGLGIVWYTSSNADFERGDTGESGDGTQKEGLRPAMYKSIQPPAHDLNFHSICNNTETRVLMAHIRAASGTPITPVNNHPFIFGRHSFMHNGAITNFSILKLEMCQKMSAPAYANIKGGTDSEHMAALYISYLTNFDNEASFEREYSVEQMATAMTAMITTVLELQANILGPKAIPNSLNLCATDGVKMVACRFRNHATQEPPSLYYSTNAGTTLNRKYPDNPDGVHSTNRFSGKAVEDHGKHIIIASEPSTYKAEDWHLIPRNSLVTASGEHGVQITPIAYDPEWNAEDPTAVGS